MGYSINRYVIACSVVLFLFSTFIILSAYGTSGVGWDFLSHYLDGRTLSSGYFYSHLDTFSRSVPVNITIGGTVYTYRTVPPLTVSDRFYFDDVWEPLSPVLIGIFILLAGGMALELYLVFLIALLFVASYVAARKLDLNPLLLCSIMIGPYVLMVTVLYNGAEILALSLALIAVGFASRKDYRAGVAFGLMGLAKYDSLILSPMLLLLGGWKGVLKAIALFALVASPWLIFNFLLFGNPLQSYMISIIETQPQHASLIAYFQLLGSIIWYPAILLLVAIALLAYIGRKGAWMKRLSARAVKRVLRKQEARVLALFLLLAFAGFLLVYNSVQGPARLGYLAYGSTAMLAASALGCKTISNARIRAGRHCLKVGQLLPYLVFLASLTLLAVVYLSWSGIGFNVLGSLGSRAPEFAAAVNALQVHGLLNCRIVSNAWPYMNYYNVTAYAPYLCNATVERMPIVVFGNIGVSSYCTGSVYSLAGISRSYVYPNFSIYLPDNYTCMK